ncbi:hypothetical protein LTR09_004955 [Extremus antarcticus]|uniref:Uncharacterized protein n=1 Tax=Extremus antarcticus TaxID=702011 RepID=A0AAJ0GDT8_9PEZI|nr:hypothetical protein LTR09_004955 [Extremus antarcticus]
MSEQRRAALGSGPTSQRTFDLLPRATAEEPEKKIRYSDTVFYIDEHDVVWIRVYYGSGTSRDGGWTRLCHYDRVKLLASEYGVMSRHTRFGGGVHLDFALEENATMNPRVLDVWDQSVGADEVVVYEGLLCRWDHSLVDSPEPNHVWNSIQNCHSMYLLNRAACHPERLAAIIHQGMNKTEPIRQGAGTVRGSIWGKYNNKNLPSALPASLSEIASSTKRRSASVSSSIATSRHLLVLPPLDVNRSALQRVLSISDQATCDTSNPPNVHHKSGTLGGSFARH